MDEKSFSDLKRKPPSEMTGEEIERLLCTLDGCGWEKKLEIVRFLSSKR